MQNSPSNTSFPDNCFESIDIQVIYSIESTLKTCILFLVPFINFRYMGYVSSFIFFSIILKTKYHAA